jgi:transcription elongation factor GreA
MATYNYMTQEGYDQLKKELEEMRTKGRSDMAKQIQEAREKGDLSENAEYDAAKEAQGLLEKRIAEMENSLSGVRIIAKDDSDNSIVKLLSRVTIKNHQTKKEMKYEVVPETEADLKSGKISANSPIGKGLLGKTVGDIAEIKVPNGTMTFEIVEIA